MSCPSPTVPYDSKKFHEIQDLYPARAEFDGKGGPRFVEEVLGPMIADHKMTDVFGVILLHRHADIGPDKFLVEFNRSSTPWTYRDPEIDSDHVGKGQSVIFPTSWKPVGDSGWMPYEFSFSPTGPEGKNIVDLNDAKYQDFLTAYTKAINEADLKHVVGLCTWPGDGFKGGLEFSDGTGNFWLEPGQFTEEDVASSTETMWFFDLRRRFTCICRCLVGVGGYHLDRHDHTTHYY